MAKKKYAKKYMVGKEVVPGVTTIIKGNLGWGTGALIGWAVKVTKEGKDHRTVMQDAADAGTLAHSMVEQYVRKLLNQPFEEFIEEGYSKEQIAAASNAFEAFIMWLEGSKLVIVAAEEEVISAEKRYGGTIDLRLKDEFGRVHIADVKTTNYLLPDHLIQVAAYSYAHQEQNPNDVIHAGHLLRFSKGMATTFHHTQWSIDALRLGMKAFTNLRELHDIKKEIEGAC